MRILQVVHYFLPNHTGGTEKYLDMLSKELSDAHDVYILFPIYKGKKSSFSISKRGALNIIKFNLPLSERIKHSLFFETSYWNANVEEKFLEVLNIVSPDIVHFHHLILSSASLIRVTKNINIPALITLHDYWFICPNLILLKANDSICNGPNGEGKNCFHCWNEKKAEMISHFLVEYYIPEKMAKKSLEFILKIINRPMKFKKRIEYMRTLLLNTNYIIAPSKFTKELFIKHGIPKDRILYSSHGYDLDLFNGFRKNKKRKKIILGYFGGIEKHKGIEVLIKAFNKIEDKNIELRIFGNYNPNSRNVKKLKSSIKNDNMIFFGRFKDVRFPLSEIDVLVFPSIFYEADPLTVKEAFIAKIPLIASNFPPLTESIKNYKNGLLFKVGDVDDLHMKIKQIIENPKSISVLQKGITSPRSIKDQAKEIERLYFISTGLSTSSSNTK